MQKMKKAGYILLALLLALLGLSAYAEQTAAEESAPPLEIEQPGQSESGMELSQTVEPAGAPAASTAMKPSASPEPTALPEPTVKPTPTRQSEPSVRFARNFSAQHAEKGDEITLSYTVRNEGTLSVRNIVVEDGLVGKVGTIERLDPGERRTISARVTVNQTCKSTPVMFYEYGGKTYSKRLAAQEIQLANVKMSVTLEADKKNVAPGEMVTLRLRVVNEGDVNLYGLRAVESMLGEMGSIVSVLPPGDECVVTRTVPMKSGATFR